MRVISIRANVNRALAGFQEHIRDIRSFMKREKLSLDLHKYRLIIIHHSIVVTLKAPLLSLILSTAGR